MMSKVAAVLIFALGVMSIAAGGKAMRGWNPGYTVLAWLPVYNFVMGVLTLIPAALTWFNHRYAMPVSLAAFGVHALVLLLLLTIFRDAVARQSIAAMSFRLFAWLFAFALLYFSSRKP